MIKTIQMEVIVVAMCLMAMLLPNQGSASAYLSKSLHSQITHVQPMTGLVFWAENESDLAILGNRVQLEFSYLTYADVIDDEGVYDWSVVDDLLATAAARGRQVVIRFRYTYPGETDRSVPLYITQQPGYEDQIVKVEGANTYIPDWSHAGLEYFTLAFYTEFSKRYDSDPRLAFVQIGFGSYAEYHLYDGPFQLGQTFPSKSFQTAFLTHVDTLFHLTQWSISIDAAEGSYSPISANPQLVDLNFGLFDDSFLHEEHSENDQEYNRASWLFFGENRATRTVAGGELNYYSDYDQQHALDANTGPWGISYEVLSEMYGVSYMLANDQLNYQSKERIEEAGMANGYRFEVTSYASDGVSTEVTIFNSGIAPIYYDAYPTVNGVRSDVSLKGLGAGEAATYVVQSPALGEDFTITCDRLVPGQEIQFEANIEEETITGNHSYDSSVRSIIYYPNPSTGKLHLSSTVNTTIKIYNSLGMMVLSHDQLKGASTLDLSALPSGHYYIECGGQVGSRVGSFVKY